MIKTETLAFIREHETNKILHLEETPDKEAMVASMLQEFSVQHIAGDFVLRTMDTRKWYWCKCESCGWEDSSEFCEGGHPIADTGDYSDPICPVCGSNKIDGDPVCEVPETGDIVKIMIPFDVFITPYKKELEQKENIIYGMEEGSAKWKSEYDNCRTILAELLSLKKLKDGEGKTEDYLQRQPVAWKEAETFLSNYQHL